MKKINLAFLLVAAMACEAQPESESLLLDESSDSLAEEVGSTRESKDVAFRTTPTDRETAIFAKRNANAWLGLQQGGITHFSDGARAIYDYGRIYFSDDVGRAHFITGFILDNWKRVSGTPDSMGYPTTDELDTAYGDGRYNNFEKGTILWKSGAAKAYSVQGCKKTVFQRSGCEHGALGWPSGDERNRTSGNGVAQKASNFEHGYMYSQGTTNCGQSAWPVLTSTSSQAHAEEQGFPVLTKVQLDANGNLVGLKVEGKNFSANATVEIVFNNPDSQLFFATATTDSYGKLNFSRSVTNTPPYSNNFVTINDLLTIQVRQSNGKGVAKAVSPYVGLQKVGLPYTGTY